MELRNKIFWFMMGVIASIYVVVVALPITHVVLESEFEQLATKQCVHNGGVVDYKISVYVVPHKHRNTGVSSVTCVDGAIFYD